MNNNTHGTAAGKNDQEAADCAGGADHPCQTDEEDHAEDILDAWQVHPYQSTHAGRWCGLGSIRVGGGRYGVGVIRQ